MDNVRPRTQALGGLEDSVPISTRCFVSGRNPAESRLSGVIDTVILSNVRGPASTLSLRFRSHWGERSHRCGSAAAGHFASNRLQAEARVHKLHPASEVRQCPVRLHSNIPVSSAPLQASTALQAWGCQALQWLAPRSSGGGLGSSFLSSGVVVSARTLNRKRQVETLHLAVEVSRVTTYADLQTGMRKLTPYQTDAEGSSGLAWT
jgi:hypothetical protein